MNDDIDEPDVIIGLNSFCPPNPNRRWRYANDFDGAYSVSDDGYVVSNERVIPVSGNGKERKVKARLLKPQWIKARRSSQVATRVSLSREGIVSDFTIAKLMLETFVGPSPDGLSLASFGNGDLLHPKLENLLWSNRSKINTDDRRGKYKLFREKGALVTKSYTPAPTTEEESALKKNALCPPNPNRVWRDVAGSSGAYSVSNDGYVVSNERKHSSGKGERIRKPQLLKAYGKRARDNNSFNPAIVLYINGVKKAYKVARLMLETFVGPNEKAVAGFLDGVHTNLTIENLFWDSKGRVVLKPENSL